MFARGRGSVRALYYTVLYVLCKTSMSPNLTLLYHHMINLISAHDKPHHHMTDIIYLVTEWDFRFPFMSTWRMISQKNFHIACAPRTHSILNKNFSNQNIISFIPWISHILLYVVDSTNRQCNTYHFGIFNHAFAALLPLWDFQSSLVSWLQPSLPLSTFNYLISMLKWLLIPNIFF